MGIDPSFRNTPLLLCEPLDELAGCHIALKVETANPVRSFKGRGADWFLRHVGGHRRLVCASAGNFGLAMAYGCRARGLALTVFAAQTASDFKLHRIRALGAHLVQAGEDLAEAKHAAHAWAQSTGALLIEDGREPAISEGAGSIGVELAQSGRVLDAVVVPVGDGALIAGIGRWLKATSPSTEVIGVVSAGAPALRDSWRTHRLVRHDRVDTIADGIAIREPIDIAVDDVRGVADDLVTVRDDQLVEAMYLIGQHAGLLVEPSAAAGVAAVFADPERFATRRIATVLTGNNMSRPQMQAWRL